MAEQKYVQLTLDELLAEYEPGGRFHPLFRLINRVRTNGTRRPSNGHGNERVAAGTSARR